ncbi:MAG: cyclic nucleotide-binding domain-containing protein, partial [Ilumatobacteraceae bacterium]
MRDRWLRRLVVAHGCSAVSEWAVTVGLLVYAFEWGGSTAVGAVSIVVLLLPLVCTPLVGSAIGRCRPQVVRTVGFAMQAVANAGAAVGAMADLPAPWVAALVVVALVGAATVPPTSAALMPLIACSADDLISVNLWVSHCDSASALVGSLIAGVVLAVAEPGALFAACALAAVVALVVTVWRPAPMAIRGRPLIVGGRGHSIRRALRELRARPWSRGVVMISSARNVVVGAFDVVLVVLALEVLDLGEGGPGFLSALVGVGALCSTFVVAAVVRRSRLRGALMVAVAVAALLAVLLSVWTDDVVVVVVLPLIGLAIACMDALSRTLLQRSSDPRQLGSLFAAFGFVAGFGQLLGSVVAQIAIVLDGARLALAAIGVVLVILAAASVRSLRSADAHTDLPVSEMAVLAGVPMLSRLPAVDLEQVARLAVRQRVDAGATVLVEGEPGVDCVVVVDGTFDVTMKGVHQREARRGDAVGELGLLSNVGQTSTATARTPGTVLRIGRDPFLVALTGFDVAGTLEVPDSEVTLARYRRLVADEEGRRDSGVADRPETWIELGAVGRLLGDPTFTDSLRRGIGMAEAKRDETLFAHAVTMTTWPGTFFHVAENPDPELIELSERALERLRPDDPMRVRVLATLASHATFAFDADRRAEIIGEAARLAERHGDPALTGAVLNAEFICLWEPATLERRRRIASSLIEVAALTGDIEFEFLGGFFAAYCTAESGELAQAREQLVALRSVVARARIEYFDFLTERLILSIDIVRGEADVRERIDALARRHAATHADTDGTWAIQTGALAYQDGTLGSMRSVIVTMTEGPHARTWQAALALAELMDGDL